MSGAETATDEAARGGALAVLRNRPFLLLWLAQAATQIGGNMVLFALTLIVLEASQSKSAVSALILTFLVPAVLFSALAGVFVDRLDRRLVLVGTNIARGLAILAIFFAGDNILIILVLNFVVSMITVFFAPAEASMIPNLVPREQLLAANGLFTLTLNAAFALGFALLGPFLIAVAGPSQGPGAIILVVALLYLVAAGFCWTLPAAPPTAEAPVTPRGAVADAEQALGTTLNDLREGVAYIRANRNISWSLTYLGIAASLIGVLGVLGPDFAARTLGLSPSDFGVIVLPLGFGIVTGVLFLNSYGRYLARRRVIEVGLVLLGFLLTLLSIARPVSDLLTRVDRSSQLVDLSGLTSLLAVVVAIAFFAGISYAVVAIPSQTQLQEDIPEEARGRIFGILGMLVSVASFLPIIVVGPISDFLGTTAVLLIVAVLIFISGVASIVRRGPLLPEESRATADTPVPGIVAEAGVPAGHGAPLPVTPIVAPATVTVAAGDAGRRRRATDRPAGPGLWDDGGTPPAEEPAAEPGRPDPPTLDPGG